MVRGFVALLAFACSWCGAAPPAPAAEMAARMPVGLGRRDITPDFPVRLTGYASRSDEATSVAQRIWAKALSVGSGSETAVLVTVDNCGVTADITGEVARRLQAAIGLPRERLAVFSTHTHSAPCTTGFAPNIFAKPIPSDELERIRRYTGELTDAIEAAALDAVRSATPATLAWGVGEVGFAANRRQDGGPVDHRLPVLVVRDPGGAVRGIFANYACHCTTLGGDFNQVCGDWAGFAQEALEGEIPGAQAMVAIGCGADANPQPRHGEQGLALARQHGESLAREAVRVAGGGLTPLPGLLRCRMVTAGLPYQTHFDRAELEERSTQDGIVGYHARRWIERLDRGEPPPATLDYPIQVWRFGDALTMVNLAGEVVVDYARRLYSELGADHLWINAYANDVPCYIPSRRILDEGGYEAETSLWYYDRPQQLAPECEDLLVDTVAELVGAPGR